LKSSKWKGASAIPVVLICCAILGTQAGADEGAAEKTGSRAAKVDDVPIDRETMPGASAYRGTCAQCHDHAVYKAPARSFLQMMSPDAIYAALTTGVMQTQAAALTKDEKREVADYLGDSNLARAGNTPPAPACTTPTGAYPDQVRINSWGVDLRNSHGIAGTVAGLPERDVSRLRLKWAFAYPGAQRARSQPTVARGLVFVGSQSGAVFSLDAKSGCLHWSFQASAEVRTSVVLSQEDRGGKGNGRMVAYFGDVLGHIYALDALSGAALWKRRIDDHPSATVTGSPVYYAGRLYVTVSSLEEATAAVGYECCTFRGSVVALDAGTGAILWKSYTIDKGAALTGKTSSGTGIFGPSGVAIWNAATIDVKRRLLYVGTGDNYTAPTTAGSDAVLAFDLETGALRWSHQVVGGDAWNVACVLGNDNCPANAGPDFDIGAGTMLVPVSPRGDLVVAGLKSGQVIALDADRSGREVWSGRLGRGGIEGGVQFGMAFDQHAIYVPISDMTSNHDGKVASEPPRPGLYAVDPATGKVIWSAPTDDICAGRSDCDPGILAAITAIPGAVFAGHMDGRIRAYDSATGHILWQYDSTQEVTTVSGATARGGSVGGGGPVVADGMVFVNSGYGIYWHMPGNLLLAFSVDGK
jgi:polyvinyl alcohol dehydrogenase (cytochrome)